MVILLENAFLRPDFRVLKRDSQCIFEIGKNQPISLRTHLYRRVIFP